MSDPITPGTAAPSVESSSEAESVDESPYSATAIEIGRMLDYFGDNGASDIHLTPERGLWYVKDKSTLSYEDVPKFPQATIEKLIEEFAHGGMRAFLEAGQADCSFDIGGQYRGRMAARRTIAGTTMTIRIISRRIPTPQELKLPDSLIEAIRRPAGLLLFTGQTGSGKSTSIAALVNEVNMNEPSSIYTLEHPIEFVYPPGRSLVNQREVGDHVRSFHEGIQNAKRSHPKIIIIGEIVNAATAKAAVDAAASGHLVVSTMHAGSTAEAIDGLISMFPPNEQQLMRTQLAQTLLSVVVQNLIPRIGGGLAMAQEIAHNTNTFSEMIRGSGGEGGDMKLVQQHLLGGGRQERMVAMETALTELVKSGEIEPDTARMVARDERVINQLLVTAGFPPTQKD